MMKAEGFFMKRQFSSTVTVTVFYAVLDELDDLEADVCQLIDDGGQRAVAWRPQEADLVPSAAGNMALQRNVDRLFREKLKIFRDVSDIRPGPGCKEGRLQAGPWRRAGEVGGGMNQRCEASGPWKPDFSPI